MHLLSLFLVSILADALLMSYLFHWQITCTSKGGSIVTTGLKFSEEVRTTKLRGITSYQYLKNT